jgi:hypothetical protein
MGGCEAIQRRHEKAARDKLKIPGGTEKHLNTDVELRYKVVDELSRKLCQEPLSRLLALFARNKHLAEFAGDSAGKVAGSEVDIS